MTLDASAFASEEPRHTDDLDARFVEGAEREYRKFVDDVRRGLGRPKNEKAIPSKYLYDDSDCWRRITELKAYYVPAVESSILKARASDIAVQLHGDAIEVVELGCGCHEKTFDMLSAFAGKRVIYYPVDICPTGPVYMRQQVTFRLPGITVREVVGEYEPSLQWFKSRQRLGFRLFLFLGSSLGNLTDADAACFLHMVRTVMEPGDRFLVGFDLPKDLGVLQGAYDNPVTAEFNLNVLRRMNRELDANFDLGDFEHVARWNAGLGSMTSCLRAKREHRVNVKACNLEVTFAKGEEVFTERSRKWSVGEVDRLAAWAGLRVVERYLDDDGYFMDALFALSCE